MHLILSTMPHNYRTNNALSISRHVHPPVIGITGRNVCDLFWDEVTKYDNKEEMPPIINIGKFYLINIYRDNVYLACTTTSETSPLSVIEFLHRVFDTFEEYFGSVEENTIKDNFSTVYQLLEEMMDYGFPLTTEPNALKAMIKPPSIVSRISSVMGQDSSNVSDVLPDGTISSMPWREAGVQYTNNEIYLDIVEEVDSTLTVDGLIISSEVSGVIMGNSKLSGIPDLSLQFVDPSLIDDCSFHPCVRYTRFDRDKVVSFVPPDGPFELMRYRVTSKDGHTIAPCYCSPNVQYDFDNNKGQITLVAGTRATSSLLYPSATSSSTPSIEEVMVEIPFPRAVRTANLKVTQGKVLYDESTKVAKWTIGKLNENTSVQLTGTMILTQSTQSNQTGTEESPPIQVNWKVPMASLSGLSVKSLALVNESYKPYKGIRTIAKSGKFQVRTI